MKKPVAKAKAPAKKSVVKSKPKVVAVAKAPAKKVVKAVAKPSQKKVKFVAQANPGCVVYVAGSFNEWNPSVHQLKHSGDGSYELVVTLAPGRYEYKFVVDGQWMFDNSAAELVPDSFGSMNSVLDVL